jgi:predicted lipid-binding transport protein (Tim44 family)
MRGLAGGIAGGFLGSMLFGTLGHAGGFGGGGGVGILEILLIAGLAFFGFRWWKNRNQTTPFNRNTSSYSAPTMEEPIMNQPNFSSLDTEEASDMFFKIQGAWTRRDLSSVRDLLGGEMPSVLNRDLEDLKRNQQINRLENISVRRTDVTDSWNENGVDYSTVRFTANLLDYVVDEKTSQVVQGSDSSPVKFEEDWTFAKNPGTPNWQLVAIQQV